MKKFLRVLLAWIERKWPDQVILTPQIFSQWVSIMNETTDRMQTTQARVTSIEEKILILTGSFDKQEKRIDLILHGLEEISKHNFGELQKEIEKIKGDLSKIAIDLGMTSGRQPFQR